MIPIAFLRKCSIVCIIQFVSGGTQNDSPRSYKKKHQNCNEQIRGILTQLY
ncbi:hypothetical protein bas20_0059 [Escherichia phage FritzHoffmann]|nr:hypothetical protein bas19_0061 [Escherichia phage ChristophMerian]QXV79324.1 hypothetical protein bas20_0059 [Escherichia phage FritzHoffmann]